MQALPRRSSGSRPRWSVLGGCFSVPPSPLHPRHYHQDAAAATKPDLEPAPAGSGSSSTVATAASSATARLAASNSSSSSSSLRFRRNQPGLELDLLPLVLENTAELFNNEAVHSVQDLQRLYDKFSQSPGSWEHDFALAKQDDGLHADFAPYDLARGRNRYANIRCLESTRVRLEEAHQDSDFIHANFVSLPTARQNHQVIVTQSPLRGTAEHFWEMCWEQQVPLIVMLNELEELGKEPAFAYFPTVQGESRWFGRYGVTCVHSDDGAGFAGWRQTRLRLECGGRAHTVVHLHCVEWEDCMHLDGYALLGLRHAIEQMHELRARTTVVHCSAGAGRSGTLVAILALVEMARQGQYMLPSQLVLELRRQRCGMVQTTQQYQMVVAVALDLLTDNQQ